MDSIVRNTITPLVADKESIERLARVSRKYEKGTGVHLKIDTGMGRIGCTPEQAASLAEAISDNSWLHLEGVCTHFPKADYSDQTFTRKQLDRFNTALQAIRNRGIDPGIIHAANSGAVLDCPYSYFDMVRPGILLYGYYPSRDQARPLPVKPVMELVTKIVFLKKVPPQTPISYGGTYITHRETVIATLPVGYGDGIPRLLSNKAEVLIKGKRYPIVGTICMDQIMVDMGPQPEVELYDPVTLFGPDPEGPSAEEYSSLIGTIPYEITTGIASRVPRVYRE
jgi:alanine racemase